MKPRSPPSLKSRTCKQELIAILANSAVDSACQCWTYSAVFYRWFLTLFSVCIQVCRHYPWRRRKPHVPCLHSWRGVHKEHHQRWTEYCIGVYFFVEPSIGASKIDVLYIAVSLFAACLYTLPAKPKKERRLLHARCNPHLHVSAMSMWCALCWCWCWV